MCLKYKKKSNIYRFHSIELPLSVSKQFSISIKSPSQKITRRRKFPPLLSGVNSQPPWQNVKQQMSA